jgi:hypothetical protein
MGRQGSYIVSWENVCTGEYLEHWNGIPWHSAPKRRRMHRCYAQSRGYYLHEQYGPAAVERCACGGVNLGDGWIDRYSRVS